MSTRVLIVVFDALRPEFVTPELMGNLHAFATEGCRFDNHHSTFPTETRVNQSAVITGCYPQNHGVVANRFPLPSADGGASGVVSTGDDIAFAAMLEQMSEPLLGVPALGAILTRHGKRLATISAGTSGGGRLINLHADDEQGVRFTLRRPEVSVPTGLPDQIAVRIGAMPRYEQPAVAWNQYAVDAWLDLIEPETRPDVTLLWLCEPDESFHWHGIGSPQALEAIRGVDQAFGQIVSRKKDEIASGDLHVIAMSDHGQISLSGGKLGIVDQMVHAGLRAADHPGLDVDFTVTVHNSGGIWVRGADQGLIASGVEWLEAQPWCGAAFTRQGIAGTLRHQDILTDHRRAPDIYVTLAHDDRPNHWGIFGSCADNAPYPDGNGCHGGLSTYELQNFLAVQGTAFKQGARFDTPSGNVDILPTLVELMSMPSIQTDGRVLREAFVGCATPPWTIETLNGGRTRLQRSHCDGTIYLDRGWAT
ncbi:MAG: nucleotide pyrophosphatase/phosphodiesterase family protein [Pseudomonadota bacterium]